MCQFCGIFGGFFAVVEPILHERCLSQVVPLCLVPEIALPRACRADDFGWFGHGVHFLRFFAHFCFFQRRFEHGRFSCKGTGHGRQKFQRRFAVSCSRPTALQASQPSLLSFSSLSTFLLQFFPFSQCFLHFFLFSPFSLLPSFFFSPFFPQFTSNFPSLPSISRFFPRFLVKATRLHVTLCQQCAPRGTGY